MGVRVLPRLSRGDEGRPRGDLAPASGWGENVLGRGFRPFVDAAAGAVVEYPEISMSRIRDPDLEQLVEELNQSETSVGGISPKETLVAEMPSARLGEGGVLEEALHAMVRRGASDLLLIPGEKPILRIDGKIEGLDALPLDDHDLRSMFAPRLDQRLRARLEEEGAVDFSLRLGPSENPWRFRINLHRQRSRLAAAIRSLPRRIPTLGELNLPSELSDLVATAQGLVLVCGPTGAGKTSTLAALVGEINRRRACHVLSIEDPVEYEHRNLRAVIEQVEIGTDSPSFGLALKAALRQDPDVILVGEMRDLETIATALTAAETGHLILSTLHTPDSLHAIHRIVDAFPEGQQEQIRLQLALSLHAVICQHLLPRAGGGGRVPAVEILRATPAVRNHIRTGTVQRIPNEITLGKRAGMTSMEASLASLVKKGLVDAQEARMRSTRPAELDSLLRE